MDTMKNKTDKTDKPKNPAAVALALSRWPGHTAGASQPRRLRCDTIDRINAYRELNGLDLFDRALNSALDRAEILQPAKPHFDAYRDNGGRTNEERANDAAEFVTAYAATPKNGIMPPFWITVRDMIADLGHWCDREGFDFTGAVIAALRNWRAER
jgi:hypothetical protein